MLIFFTTNTHINCSLIEFEDLGGYHSQTLHLSQFNYYALTVNTL